MWEQKRKNKPEMTPKVLVEKKRRVSMQEKKRGEAVRYLRADTLQKE